MDRQQLFEQLMAGEVTDAVSADRADGQRGTSVRLDPLVSMDSVTHRSDGQVESAQDDGDPISSQDERPSIVVQDDTTSHVDSYVPYTRPGREAATATKQLKLLRLIAFVAGVLLFVAGIMVALFASPAAAADLQTNAHASAEQLTVPDPPLTTQAHGHVSDTERANTVPAAHFLRRSTGDDDSLPNFYDERRIHQMTV